MIHGKIIAVSPNPKASEVYNPQPIDTKTNIIRTIILSVDIIVIKSVRNAINMKRW